MVTTTLRERMRSILRTRNYSARTEETYIAAVARFARHFGKPPDQLGPAQVTEYQIWLREHKQASATLANQAVCALRFLYREVLGRPDEVERIPYARRERRLPVVLSPEETARFLVSIPIARYRVLFTTIYATGLRISEALALRAGDIDSSRMLIRVRQGKGKKDRYVPLSPILLNLLRKHWSQERLTDLLFPAFRDRSRSLDPATVQKYVARACERAGLRVRVTPRTLRHCYATHLIENGTSTRVVQVLLGHSNVHTTEIYTHVTPQTMGKIVNPLDQIAALLSEPVHD
ncbi:MAG: tyrosine-type recombinase/integrase [Longimicrobiales bacterium]